MTKLNEMWAALTAYQPQADAAGHGESWAKMCREKTARDAADARDAAYDADAADAVYDAVYAVYDAAHAADAAEKFAQRAIECINKVLVKPAQQEQEPVMSKQIEALKLALEALEKLWNIIDDIDTYGDMAKGDKKLYRALVERRQRTRFEETGISTDGYELTGGVIIAIKEALAQPEQKPAMWVDPDWIKYGGSGEDKICDSQIDGWISLYTSPPAQRTWVGLTKTAVGNHLRRHALGDQPTFRQGFREGVAFAEAKLRSKNT